MNELFTIGYSGHSIESFVRLLKRHGVKAIADVRSQPYSRFKPVFNRETLKEALKRNDIAYVFLGDHCGARIEDPGCYVEGKADYRLIARHPKFQEGLNRILNGLQNYRIALMCSEKDPLTCHRAILICRNLRSDNLRIRHILNSGKLEDHEDSERRLMRLFKLDEGDLFKPESSRLEEAYDRQGESIAYTRGEKRQGEKITGGEEMSRIKLHTIGFTKKKAKTFFEVLKKAHVKRVIDIRLNNVSQLAGFAKRDDLTFFLKELCGCDYQHLPLMAPTKNILDDYKKKKIGWSEYEVQFDKLMEERKVETMITRDELDGACLLCSEPTAERCHRRLVAEYLKEKLGNIDIKHL